MLKPALIMLLLLLPGWGVQAIVVRHDTGYAQHLASETQFPAVFWLQQKSQRKVCVATLIAPQWALTAAHCVEETGIQRNLESDAGFHVSIAREQIGIEAAILHPNYQYRYSIDNGELEVDLALLRLERAVETVRPLSLYAGTDELEQVATFLGWGYFGIGTTGIQVDDGRLRKAQNRVSAVSSGRLNFLFDDPRVDANTSLSLEGLPGLGDSGGPALLPSSEGYVLAGIAVGEISAVPGVGEGQGLYGATAVYERVSSHRAWIENTIEAYSEAGT
ncbi:MAG: trypsin-like serine protease [Pseudohongiellaceae bacterium]|nr:trypsin-like serine protease [Pseudohongiellaceae bacterium]